MSGINGIMKSYERLGFNNMYPVLVYVLMTHDGARYYCIDGMHRVKAAQQFKAENIEAYNAKMMAGVFCNVYNTLSPTELIFVATSINLINIFYFINI